MGLVNKKKKTETLKADSFRPVAPSSKADKDKSKIYVGDTGEDKNHFGSRVQAYGRKNATLLIALAIIGVSVLSFVVYGVQNQREANKVVDAEIELANDAVLQDDPKKALQHAKRAYEASPDNLDAILLLAELTKKENPTEAKKLYGQALDAYKDQNNFDDGDVNAIENWAAAGLAEDAGNKAEALKYYKQVLIKASAKDGYESSLIRQSIESIERLR